MFLKAKIISHHNILSTNSFELMSSPSSLLSISEVKKNSFMLSVESLPKEDKGSFMGRAHSVISFYVVALNVASLGHFSWDFQLVSPVPYFMSNSVESTGEFQFLHKPSGYKFDEEMIPLPRETSWQVLKIMIALGKERDDVFISEYIKGIFNLHNCFFNISFINEAFANFYRALEYFTARKILRCKKLKNEKVTIKV